MTILVVGDANADVGAALSRFPREGDDSPVRELAWGSGGTGVNVAAALALLGAPARLLARVGGDPAADVALRAARAAGVDLAFIERDGRLATGLCYAAVSPSGERTFFSYRGANVALELPNVDELFRDVSWLHIGGHSLLEGSQEATVRAVLKEASRRRVPASLDLCRPLLRTRPSIVSELAPDLAVLFANEPELAALSGSDPSLSPGSGMVSSDPVSAAVASIVAIERAIPVRVVAKLGPRGSVIGGDPPTLVPGLPVVARDTTGCGDSFIAAFLAAQTRGVPAIECARLGNAVGALVASRLGAADTLPTREELFVFLEERGEATAIAAFFPPDFARSSAP
jgi:sugar/nucleoside kinase (ribokinase family)